MKKLLLIVIILLLGILDLNSQILIDGYINDDSIVLKKNCVLLLPEIHVDAKTWKEMLRLENKYKADYITKFLTKFPTTTIEIRCHSGCLHDTIGTFIKTNQLATDLKRQVISSGIDSLRLISRGYGASNPRVVSQYLAKIYPFLQSGSVLSRTYINRLESAEKKEIADQINRRIEIKIINF
jgi:outer membrane protein OmpA-like peptidoglycan-associated protein